MMMSKRASFGTCASPFERYALQFRVRFAAAFFSAYSIAMKSLSTMWISPSGKSFASAIPIGPYPQPRSRMCAALP